jgi:acetylglutamate kinase
MAQLCMGEREVVSQMVAAGYLQKEIAARLERARSTIAGVCWFLGWLWFAQQTTVRRKPACPI